jgi:hypothetical protein
MNTRVIRISTTAYSDENFYLITSLSDVQIKSVVKPIVQAERDGKTGYDNDDLIHALVTAYPDDIVEMHYGVETLSI